jgi:predicted Zn finger-like uncharacterized protein
MIIKCDKCLTKFRLDDARVTEKGVKVRCTKCKHVFAVRREQPVFEAQEPAAAPELLAAAASLAVPASVSAELQQPETEQTAGYSFESSELQTEISDTPADFGDRSFTALENVQVAPEPETGEFTFSAKKDSSLAPPERDDAVSASGDFDFDSFDFGSSQPEAAVALMPTEAPAEDADTKNAPVESHAPAAQQGLDFSDDDMFGSVAAPKAEENDEAISFDFDTDSFAESIDTGIPDASVKNTAPTVGTNADIPFNLGDIDFGDELTSVAVQQVNPEKLKPSQEILFAPLAEAQEKPVAEQGVANASPGTAAESQQELPPLPIASRRKQSPLFGVIIAVVVLLVVGTLGYFGFSTFAPEKAKSPEETGKISIIGVKAGYIESKSSGTLLVISGEARNDFSKPRAALQVKGNVYGSAGQVLISKEAYCGNRLTNEQLENFPLERIEATMANQFGDSLDNMEVAPGKAVQFTIVIPSPPAGAKDFGVEAIGSTVAAGKQQ